MTPVQLPEVPAPYGLLAARDVPYGELQGYTAAQLREYAMAYGVQLLDEFLRMAAEPVGLECCGHGRGECCGEPEPVYASSGEVFQAMSERLAALATPSETNSER